MQDFFAWIKEEIDIDGNPMQKEYRSLFLEEHSYYRPKNLPQDYKLFGITAELQSVYVHYGLDALEVITGTSLTFGYSAMGSK